MIATIARSGTGTFLAVLNTFSERKAPRLLSFPQPGVTLALDFPDGDAATAQLFVRLDGIVRQAGGQIHPAKDACMSRNLFESGYPALSTSCSIATQSEFGDVSPTDGKLNREVILDTQKRIVIVSASAMIAQHCASLRVLGQSAEVFARRMPAFVFNHLDI